MNCSSNRNHWNTLFEARVVIGDFKHEHNHRPRRSALGYRTPAEYAARCRCTHTPVACEMHALTTPRLMFYPISPY